MRKIKTILSSGLAASTLIILVFTLANAAAVPSSYLVFGLPVESPHFALPAPPADGRTAQLSPWLDAPTASPLGWHATSIMSWTNTQGNNVDTRKGAIRYDCGPTLECDPPLDLTMEPTTPGNLDAALVNLFYWTNIVHDVTYEYGFDEAAGNFQDDNFGLGGQDGDRLLANVQAPFSCGASFSAPPDGTSPTMNAATCGLATPARDGALDNLVVAHEYGHGVSVRLAGGPSNSSCLNNAEQMGEGWADWLGLMLTIEPGDAGTDHRTIGTWLFGQGPAGPGIRGYPYTTDFTTNPHTYNDIITAVSSHDVGEVWATMLWDMVWAMIDRYGYNPDFYAPWHAGGNNLAFQLVIDGLKLQPCGPGFVDGRDAILMADTVLTGGQNQCLIWEAFAGRGLGHSAGQGSPNSTTDGTEAFDLPPSCSLLAAQPDTLEICAGDPAEYQLTAGTGFTPDIALSLSGHPSGTSAVFSPNPITAVPATATLTIANTGPLPLSTYTLTITAADSAAITDSRIVSLDVFDAAPPPPALTSPPNNAAAVSLTPTFEWAASSAAVTYLFELDDAPDFINPLYTAAATSTTHTPPLTLAYETTYYWRVTAENICGPSPLSPIFSFITLPEAAAILIRTPDLIEATAAPGQTVTRTVTITNAGTLSFTFAAAANAPWAAITPAAGTLAPNQSLGLTILLNSALTPGPGTYTTTLTFTGTFGNNPTPVTLILHVLPGQNAVYTPVLFNPSNAGLVPE